MMGWLVVNDLTLTRPESYNAIIGTRVALYTPFPLSHMGSGRIPFNSFHGPNNSNHKR